MNPKPQGLTPLISPGGVPGLANYTGAGIAISAKVDGILTLAATAATISGLVPSPDDIYSLPEGTPDTTLSTTQGGTTPTFSVPGLPTSFRSRNPGTYIYRYPVVIGGTSFQGTPGRDGKSDAPALPAFPITASRFQGGSTRAGGGYLPYTSRRFATIITDRQAIEEFLSSAGGGGIDPNAMEIVRQLQEANMQ